MQYSNIKQARFLSRPNRFIAHVELDGQKEIAHVKNTGRCKELLIPGASVFVQKADSTFSKT
jgi:sugar fermentation stimulation protein A